MGEDTVLLVKRRTALGLIAGAFMPLGSAQAGPVDAGDYDAFWLWAGVTSQPVLAGARSLYFLQGEVGVPRRRGEGVRLVAQSGASPHLRSGQIWLAYRASTLDWPPVVYGQILARLERWRAAGQPVTGLQIDFDSGTRQLAHYGRFLADLRARLPADYRLSITGLLDWSSQAGPTELASLRETVDEIVLQTYQGRHTIANYQAYVASLARLRIPFKVGLVQGGEWQAPAGLADNPWFRGYVVFLLNPMPG